MINILRNLYDRGLKYTALYKYFAEDLLSAEDYKKYLDDCKKKNKVEKYISTAARRNRKSIFAMQLDREDVEEFGVTYYDEIDKFKSINRPAPKPYQPSPTSKKYWRGDLLVEINK
jgi:hypothetical protein